MSETTVKLRTTAEDLAAILKDAEHGCDCFDCNVAHDFAALLSANRRLAGLLKDSQRFLPACSCHPQTYDDCITCAVAAALAEGGDHA